MRQTHIEHRTGFSLIELLTVVAVIAILLGLLLPALSSLRLTQRKSVEMAAARQLMVAYVGYATDNDDAVLPGYKFGLRARDHRGRPIDGAPGARYPWRLAPYVATSMEALYIGSQRELLEEAQQAGDDEYAYTVSLSPSLGLNSAWMGGSQLDGEMGFNPEFIGAVGRFYVSSLAEVRQPTRLMVFTSARGVDPLVRGQGPVEGYFRTKSPYFLEGDGDRWSDAFDPSEEPGACGFISPRYGGAAVTAFVDTHVAELNMDQLRDMRHWANRARTADYVLGAAD